MAFGAPPPDLHVGDTILWVNRDLFRHTATARDGGFDPDLSPAGTARLVLKSLELFPFSAGSIPA
ncbi:hypothetical protein GCM10009087_43820 [Sphingomonas oligophenolica]|uniref:TauD/TfdA-like domain-containing protein n=1 Tax=Sphingomonas oligophenolica TaxID=301154 RepID=A0ABU9XZQ8_9SPHN